MPWSLLIPAELAKVSTNHPLFLSLHQNHSSSQTAGFSEPALRQLVAHIQTQTGFFIEIVNLNIRNRQYVCAGDLRAVDLLQRVCDELKKSDGTATSPQASGGIDAQRLQQALAKATGDPEGAGTTTGTSLYAGKLPQQVRLRRGVATVPLVGVDVPFHSSLLRPRMKAFRRVLQESLNLDRVRPQRLVGKYIPNITGAPFEISQGYFEKVYGITQSEALRDVLDGWDGWVERVEREREGGAVATVG
jgi:fatty acid synthase subunit beta